PPSCGPTPPFLLVLIPSAAPHAARRQAVRETWGGAAAGGTPTFFGGLPSRTLFVLGVPATRAEQAAVRAEARLHGDLL
ncbi:B3GT5 galactosyltransferase, partial [Aramus guarauna]|nr:B3GT5 galactosyltransferase [Aramus guarauna]